MFSLIAAVDNNYGISKDGKTPWKCLEDLKHFKKLTKGNIVIMCRETWESLPDKYKPLPDRINVVISKSLYLKGKDDLNIDKKSSPHIIFETPNMCVAFFNEKDIKKKYQNIKKFIIGGASMYTMFLKHNLIYDLHITILEHNFKCTQFLTLPNLLDSNEEIILCKFNDPGSNIINTIDNDNPSYLIKYKKYFTINYEEYQFLDTMNDIIRNGTIKQNRTGIATKSIFSRDLRFNLRNGQIPMTTTRPVSIRYIFEELMWVLRGETNNKILNKKKIHIWDDNTSREFLDKSGLKWLPEGDIGASYGFQMRRYGAKYLDCNTNYELKGFDQLEYVINLIINNPNSRRIIMNLWNPTQLNEMSLPPCLYGYQFYVDNGYLSCKLIQRSSDISLAGSHNCTSGALLVHMICKIAGLLPGELIWSPSDIHIYLNQEESVKTQLYRIPKPFPTLKIKNSPKKNNILKFEFTDLELTNYEPFPKINFSMNA
jgi:dihydrofolate reductase/thymidylate synthase